MNRIRLTLNAGKPEQVASAVAAVLPHVNIRGYRDFGYERLDRDQGCRTRAAGAPFESAARVQFGIAALAADRDHFYRLSGRGLCGLQLDTAHIQLNRAGCR